MDTSVRKILTVAGFYGTGSSAVANLLSECDGVVCPNGEYEMRFIHDPYGVADLEYNLVDNPNRHNTSHAIKKFKKLIDWLGNPLLSGHEEKVFHGQFKKILYEYIEELAPTVYRGQWHYDEVERGKLFAFLCRVYRRLLRPVKFSDRHLDLARFNIKLTLVPHKELAYAGIYDEDAFLTATRRCMYKLFVAAMPDIHQTDKLLIDQLLPPTNLRRYVRYFNPAGIRVFVVDRDPRDLFLLEKKIWHTFVIPHYDVGVFCEWYAWTRGQFNKYPLPENAMKVQFEDLLYKYEDTVPGILEFAGLTPESHTRPQSILVPEKSRKNTRLWEKFPEYERDIRLIEERLSGYCYPHAAD